MAKKLASSYKFKGFKKWFQKIIVTSLYVNENRLRFYTSVIMCTK